MEQWDVAGVNDMSCKFFDALSFNQYIRHWDTSIARHDCKV
ncbi:BspA family leucine-rich repeat surface protein [archaeon]|nr:MAG: BspA family leucine-rich repeat surface protein [archaeon]